MKFLILLFLITIFSSLAYGAVSEKEAKQLEETINFGIPEDRKKALKRIEEAKDDKLYFLIKKVLENDLNLEVLQMAIQLSADLKIADAAEQINKILLSTESNLIKATSLKALGKMQFQKIGNKAMEELSNELKEIKLAAIFTIGEIKEKKALEKLYEIADKIDEKEEVLQETLLAIGKIGDKKSIAKLKEIMDNPGYNKYIRMLVPQALAKIGGQEVVEIISKACEDKDYVIRIRAIHALSELKGIDFRPVQKALFASLKEADANIRLTALEVVKTIKLPEYIPFVKYMIDKDPEFKVRKKAMQVYPSLEGKETTLPFFTDKFENGEFTTKLIVLDAFREYDVKDVLSVLDKNFFSQESFDLRLNILRFLSEKTDNNEVFNLIAKIAAEPKIKGYYDSVNKLRFSAVQTLTKGGWDKCFGIVKSIAENTADPIHIQVLQIIPGIDREKAKDYFSAYLPEIHTKPFALKFQIYKILAELKPAGIEEKLKAAYVNEPDSAMRTHLSRFLKSYGIETEAMEKELLEKNRKKTEPAK